MSNELQALLVSHSEAFHQSTRADEPACTQGQAQQAASQGQNPWTAIRTAFYDSVRPTYPGYFVNQIYALSALIAVATVLLGLCMVVKMKQGTFWLVRIHRATGGSFVVLHYANTYSTLFFLFYAVLQGYMCVRAAPSLTSPSPATLPLADQTTLQLADGTVHDGSMGAEQRRLVRPPSRPTLSAFPSPEAD